MRQILIFVLILILYRKFVVWQKRRIAVGRRGAQPQKRAARSLFFFNILGMLFSMGQSQTMQNPLGHELFFQTFFGMLGKFAKADGRVQEEELEVVRNFMEKKLGLNKSQTEQAQAAFREGRDSAMEFSHYAQIFYLHFRRRPDILRTLVDLLEQVAAADRNITAVEAELLRDTKILFGFSREGYENARSSFYRNAREKRQDGSGSSDSNSPYSVLGIPANSSLDEVKKAYRRLVKECHPDRLVARGLSPELKKAAGERFRAIQEAYDQLMVRAA